MGDIGVRDLKTRASEIVREVKEHRRRYVVTRRGQPVALLVPLEEAPPLAMAPAAGAWQELLRIGEEIGASWHCAESSAELLSGMRR